MLIRPKESGQEKKGMPLGRWFLDDANHSPKNMEAEHHPRNEKKKHPRNCHFLGFQ